MGREEAEAYLHIRLPRAQNNVTKGHLCYLRKGALAIEGVLGARGRLRRVRHGEAPQVPARLRREGHRPRTIGGGIAACVKRCIGSHVGQHRKNRRKRYAKTKCGEWCVALEHHAVSKDGGEAEGQRGGEEGKGRKKDVENTHFWHPSAREGEERQWQLGLEFRGLEV